VIAFLIGAALILDQAALTVAKMLSLLVFNGKIASNRLYFLCHHPVTLQSNDSKIA